jgi:hypothetical protein
MIQNMHHVDRTAIAELRPTQLTVGYREVAAKRAAWDAMKKPARKQFLDGHVVPVVLGPGQRRYVVDHHHLARALADDGQHMVLVGQLADFSVLSKPEFWLVMQHRRWVYPFDANGERQPFDALPKTVGQLVDDPWRSLAGAVRDAGGCAKENEPFAEFLWADFLRRRLDAALLASDFNAAVAAALKLAHTAAAAHLPGWSEGAATP